MNTVNAHEMLLYHVADAMQIPMYPFGSGYLGKGRHLTKVGPWTLQIDSALLSDALEPSTASFFVHIKKDVWFYVVASDVGEKMRLYVVNGALANLNQTTLKSYGTGKVATTLQKLGKAVVASYTYVDQKWSPVN